MDVREQELQRLGHGELALKIAYWGMMVYLTIYTFESPIRYFLYLSHASAVIILRDSLMLVPLVLIGITGLLRRRLHPAFMMFAVYIFVGGIISMLNFHATFQAALGTKILMNVLFGIVVGAALIIPTKFTARYLVAIWLATVIGLILEKYFVSFPWVGLKTIIGDVQVEISRDWQITDPASKRVGGFTKQSISAAGIMGQLALISFFQFKSYFVRAGILIISIGCIYLTTQKGALIGIVVVSGVLCLPANMRLAALRITAIAGVLLVIGLPLMTNGLNMQQGQGGVFSASSFAMRINDTWPHSLAYVSDTQIFPFGVGIGGIGAGQQLAGTIVQHYPDNLFLFLYAYFGLFSLIIFGWMIYAVVRSSTIDPAVAAPALAVLSFNLLYGIVITILEDQMGALFVGSSMGVLLCASQVTSARFASLKHRAGLVMQ